ncbi:MAG: HD domain-containing protein [Bacilli bacterium]|nr:HD domain-containing protein [Bacilli bacterium]
MDKYKLFFEQQANYYMDIAKDNNQKYHINRKIEHSKRVNKLALIIGKDLKLNDQELEIINISSLLHDIGRFKQFYEFNTYNDEESFDHQQKGVEILEENNILEGVPDKIIIENIIKAHDLKEIPSEYEDKTKKYLSIVKDADKIDRLYAMINIIPKGSKEEQNIFYSNKKDINYISKNIVERVLKNEVIIKQEVETINELKIANIALVISDIKNKVSLEIIEKEGYIEDAFKLVDDSNEKIKIMEYIKYNLMKRIEEEL